MIVTTYTCDECNHSQEKATEPRQMWRIGVMVDAFDPSGFAPRLSLTQEPTKKKIWCRSCVVKFGLLPVRKDDPTPPSLPSFEDLVRALAREEIQDEYDR